MTPLVSVITTVYNCERYVKESFASIASQTLEEDFEWLILSDAPTDSTWDIIERMNLDLPRAKVIKVSSLENIKIPRRRNQAISMARGKYVAIHDGDDISLPDRLGLQVDFLESHPRVFCVGGHGVKINSEGEGIGLMDYPEEDHDGIVRQLLLKRQNPMIDPTCMFRRQTFLSLKKYTTRQDIYTVPDMDLWCRAILAGHKMANIRKPLIHYRINPNGMTGLHKPEMIYAHMIVCKEFSEAYRGKIARDPKERKNEQNIKIMDKRRA